MNSFYGEFMIPTIAFEVENQWWSMKDSTSDIFSSIYSYIFPFRYGMTSGSLVRVSQVWYGAWPAVSSPNLAKSNQHLDSFKLGSHFERYHSKRCHWNLSPTLFNISISNIFEHFQYWLLFERWSPISGFISNNFYLNVLKDPTFEFSQGVVRVERLFEVFTKISPNSKAQIAYKYIKCFIYTK